MSRTILLTGATGFVGRQVLRALDELGAHTRVIVRRGKESILPKTPIIEAVISTDDLFAESSNWWSRACVGIDTVIHVAWYAESGEYLHSEKNLDCLIGTLQLARGAAQSGVRRVVGVGTCFEYDLTIGDLSVDTPLRPLTPYGGAKAAAFLALSRWLPAQSVEFGWCRLFYLYGEGEDARRLVPTLHSKLSAGEIVELTRGDLVRDYLDVRVAAEQIVFAAMGDRTGAINICSGVPITVRALAEQVADEYGRRDLLKFGARQENPLDPPRVVGISS